MAKAAGGCRVCPVKSNAGFLRRLLLHAEIDAGRVQTSFINTHLTELAAPIEPDAVMLRLAAAALMFCQADGHAPKQIRGMLSRHRAASPQPWTDNPGFRMNASPRVQVRSEEHTSELQSLMRISYAVFCLKKKTTKRNNKQSHTITNENT